MFVRCAEEVKAERAGAGERIDKQGEPEMRREVKAAQVTCTVGADSGQCKAGKCISTGEDNVCTDCGKAGEVPINGKCVVSSDSSVTTAGCAKSDGNLDQSSTTCGKCTGTNYFLHKGGCYLQTATPGSTICTKQTAAGVCATCNAANGFFNNPEAAATTDSCISCGDATGVTIGENADSKTYKGVTNCAKCDAPESLQTSGTAVATCTECNANLYLKTVTGGTSTTSCVDESTCKEGSTHFPTTDSTASNKKVCASCGDNTKGGIDNCAECSLLTPASRSSTVLVTCTKCNDDRYLKTVDGTTTCVEKDACKDGFFPVDDPTNGHKCVSCGDTTGVTVGNGDSAKTYKGVAGCKTCTLSGSATTAMCTECAAGFLHTSSEGATSCVETCPEGYFGHTDSNTKKTCQSCATASGLTPDVAGIEGCTSCTYTEGDSGTLTCSECESGKKPSLDGLHCYACAVGNCAFCASENVCQKCISGYILDGAACTQQTCSTPDCKTCTNPKAPNETCTACVTGMFLTPTGQCIDECVTIPGYYETTDRKCKECTIANCAECKTDGSCMTCRTGFFPDANECKACDSSCKSCSGATANDCTECPAGKALKYGSDGTKGTCGEGCTTGTGKGACKTCDLTVEGTKYCSECATPTEYPQNGVCASTTTRTATCSDSPVSGGVCNTCSAGYFKMNEGCYETDRYPGKSVCTAVAASGGTCDSPAPGYNVNGGNLVTCSEGCKACSDASTCTACADGYVKLTSTTTCSKCDASCLTCETEATKCKACASGYYLSGSTCTSCESNSGGITGVSGCLSCAAPSGSTGPVLCYLVGAAPLTPSPHVPVGMSAVTDRVTGIANPLLGAHMVAERPPRQ
ncbi:Variant-specific surface protein [Giardia duodenalis]|uniref:Variant-specific surface protein n=1 Tax=Giardia intestinalis TaxID=5741 RepID=V6TVA4_GIAIN|nr:Variant-specific surface protein [Giardia intestinalis]